MGRGRRDISDDVFKSLLCIIVMTLDSLISVATKEPNSGTESTLDTNNAHLNMSNKPTYTRESLHKGDSSSGMRSRKLVTEARVKPVG